MRRDGDLKFSLINQRHGDRPALRDTESLRLYILRTHLNLPSRGIPDLVAKKERRQIFRPDSLILVGSGSGSAIELPDVVNASRIGAGDRSGTLSIRAEKHVETFHGRVVCAKST